MGFKGLNMALLILLTKNVIGELGGLRYLLVLCLVLGTVIPLLSLYSTITSLSGYIPPMPLTHAEVYKVSIFLGNLSEEGYLLCFKTPGEVVITKGATLTWLNSEGIVLPKVYEGIKRIGDLVEVVLPGSLAVQIYVVGFYDGDKDGFIMVSSACPEPSAIDGNRVIFSSLVKEVRGLAAAAIMYVHFTAILTIWLQIRRRSEALRRTLFTLRIAGLSLCNHLMFITLSIITLIINAIAVSLGVVATQIIVYVLAQLLGATILTPFIEPLAMSYTIASLFASVWLTLYIGLTRVCRGIDGDWGSY